MAGPRRPASFFSANRKNARYASGSAFLSNIILIWKGTYATKYDTTTII
jgi:hypothetical protein